MNSLILYGFAAGAVATVNPCGFALLPAWFAREMAAHGDRPAAVRLVHSVLSGGAVSLGFLAIFTIAGLIVASGAAWLGAALPWIGVALGLALAGIGAIWVSGLGLPAGRLANTCRRVNHRYGAFGFGLSYGVASISCTLPVFMSVAGIFFSESTGSGIGMLAFLAGAASVLMLVAVGGVTFGAGLSRLLQGRTALLRRIAGALTLLAGLYIALYWGRLFIAGATFADDVADAVGLSASAIAGFVSSGPGLGILAIGAVAAIALAWILVVTGNRLGDKPPG